MRLGPRNDAGQNVTNHMMIGEQATIEIRSTPYSNYHEPTCTSLDACATCMVHVSTIWTETCAGNTEMRFAAVMSYICMSRLGRKSCILIGLKAGRDIQRWTGAGIDSSYRNNYLPS